MCCINKRLKRHIFALISLVNAAKIEGMITVIVISRSVFYHRSYPHCRKAQRLDIIKFLYESFKIATPCRVSLISLLVFPTLCVVACIAVIKTGCHHKINCFITKIVAVADKSRCRCRHHKGHNHSHKQPLHQFSHHFNCYINILCV